MTTHDNKDMSHNEPVVKKKKSQKPHTVHFIRQTLLIQIGPVLSSELF